MLIRKLQSAKDHEWLQTKIYAITATLNLRRLLLWQQRMCQIRIPLYRTRDESSSRVLHRHQHISLDVRLQLRQPCLLRTAVQYRRDGILLQREVSASVTVHRCVPLLHRASTQGSTVVRVVVQNRAQNGERVLLVIRRRLQYSHQRENRSCSQLTNLVSVTHVVYDTLDPSQGRVNWHPKSSSTATGSCVLTSDLELLHPYRHLQLHPAQRQHRPHHLDHLLVQQWLQCLIFPTAAALNINSSDIQFMKLINRHNKLCHKKSQRTHLSFQQTLSNLRRSTITFKPSHNYLFLLTTYVSLTLLSCSIGLRAFSVFTQFTHTTGHASLVFL